MNNGTVWTLCYSALPPEYSLIPLTIFLLVLLNNVAVLTIFTRLKPFKLNYYIIIGLVVVDIATLIPLAISFVTLMLTRIWLTDALCDAIGIGLNGAIGATNWLHSLLCIERCISVRLPIVHKNLSLSRRSTRTMAAIVSLLIISPFPIIFFFMTVGTIKFEFLPLLASCGLDSSPAGYIALFLVFDTPKIIVQIVCYTLMINRLKNLQGADKRRVCQALKVVLMTLMLYYVCWVPFYAEFLWRVLPFSHKAPMWVPIMCLQVILLNSAMSGAIYYVSIPAFKKYVKDRV